MSNFILTIIFSFWFLLSFLAQTPNKYAVYLKTKDLFKLIPNWRFFAPVPIRKDFHLEYRLIHSNCNITVWKTVTQAKPRKYWCVIWYPDKRFRKALNTSTNKINKINQKLGFHRVIKSYPYSTILHFLRGLTLQQSWTALQFRIITKQDFEENSSSTLIFQSLWHTHI